MYLGAIEATIIPKIISIASKGIEIENIDFFSSLSFRYIHIDI